MGASASGSAARGVVPASAGGEVVGGAADGAEEAPKSAMCGDARAGRTAASGQGVVLIVPVSVEKAWQQAPLLGAWPRATIQGQVTN